MRLLVIWQKISHRCCAGSQDKWKVYTLVRTGCTDSTQKDLWDTSFSLSRVHSFLQISLNSIINVTNLCWWKRRWQLRNTKSSVLQRKHTYGAKIRPTQPLMTLMLNNEWQGKYTHQRTPAIISLSIWKREKEKEKLAGKNTGFAQNLRFRVVTVETVTRRALTMTPG